MLKEMEIWTPEEFEQFLNNVDDPEYIRKASAMIKEIGFEGVFEFEFMVGEDNELYFLEINFRNTK